MSGAYTDEQWRQEMVRIARYFAVRPLMFTALYFIAIGRAYPVTKEIANDR